MWTKCFQLVGSHDPWYTVRSSPTETTSSHLGGQWKITFREPSVMARVLLPTVPEVRQIKFPVDCEANLQSTSIFSITCARMRTDQSVLVIRPKNRYILLMSTVHLVLLSGWRFYYMEWNRGPRKNGSGSIFVQSLINIDQMYIVFAISKIKQWYIYFLDRWPKFMDKLPKLQRSRFIDGLFD